MFLSKDYSKMTLDQLVSEEKKIKSQKITTAVFVGLLVGIAVWSATHKGGFILTIGLLIFAALIGSRYSKNLKSIQAEISRRDTTN
jgi:ABC-type Mn2+/Zn2+ transport system permease subunit